MCRHVISICEEFVTNIVQVLKFVKRNENKMEVLSGNVNSNKQPYTTFPFVLLQICLIFTTCALLFQH